MIKNVPTNPTNEGEIEALIAAHRASSTSREVARIPKLNKYNNSNKLTTLFLYNLPLDSNLITSKGITAVVIDIKITYVLLHVPKMVKRQQRMRSPSPIQ